MFQSSSASETYSRTRFHVSADAVTWFEANDECRREFDSPLFDPTADPVEISMAEDFVTEHVRRRQGQASTSSEGRLDSSDGVWTGVVDDLGQCQVSILQ